MILVAFQVFDFGIGGSTPSSRHAVSVDLEGSVQPIWLHHRPRAPAFTVSHTRVSEQQCGVEIHVSRERESTSNLTSPSSTGNSCRAHGVSSSRFQSNDNVPSSSAANAFRFTADFVVPGLSSLPQASAHFGATVLYGIEAWVQHFVTGTDCPRVDSTMFWTSVPSLLQSLRCRFGQLLRQRQPTTVKTLRRHGSKECYVRRCGVTCHCCRGCLEADCCGSGNFELLTSRNPSLGATVT